MGSDEGGDLTLKHCPLPITPHKGFKGLSSLPQFSLVLHQLGSVVGEKHLFFKVMAAAGRLFGTIQGWNSSAPQRSFYLCLFPKTKNLIPQRRRSLAYG